jgi:hypothetical protein
MANKKNELVVLDPGSVTIIPQVEDMAAILAELKDIERIPYGRITVASGGLNAFKVLEPGDENATSASEIIGVILFSHKVNVKWATKFGVKTEGPKSPECSSTDGEIGIVALTGECKECATCPYNQFGTDDNARGKACRNMRRLYIMREGDVFPIILSLPATSLKAFDFYRTRLAVKRKTADTVITRISLKAIPGVEKSQEYSVAVFEADAALPPDEIARVKEYAAQFEAAAKKVAVDGVDDGDRSEPYVPKHSAPINAKNGGFIEVDPDEEDPFAVPVGTPPAENF